MVSTKSEHDWSVLQNEYNICRKKLESKREGLKILIKQLEQTQIERDISKNKVSQLQSEINGLKEVVGSFWHKSDKGGQLIFTESNDKKIKTLSSLLQFSRDENQHLENDLFNIRHLYSDTQKDNQLLRASLSKYENQKRNGLNEQQGKEKLILQLEESNARIEYFEQEVRMMNDQIQELEEERNTFREKNVRLNSELNYILHNDDKRIVDIDAIVLENQYLKEVIKQYKEEKTMALGTAARYKEALKQRHSSASNSSSKNTHDPISPKRTSTYDGFFSKGTNSITVTDLQRVNKALTERVTEKETALKHQRNTNRVLGMRVSELEKKLRTLEISGLWSHEQRTPRYDSCSTSIMSSPPLSPDGSTVLMGEPLEPYKLSNDSHARECDRAVAVDYLNNNVDPSNKAKYQNNSDITLSSGVEVTLMDDNDITLSSVVELTLMDNEIKSEQVNGTVDNINNSCFNEQTKKNLNDQVNDTARVVNNPSLNKQANEIASDATNSSLNKQVNGIVSDVTYSSLNKQANEIASDATNSSLNKQVNGIVSDVTYSSLNKQANEIASDATNSSLNKQVNGIVSDVTHSSLNKQVNGNASDATNSSLNEQDNGIPSDVNNSGLNKQVNEIVSDVTYSSLNEQVNGIASDFTDSSLKEQVNGIVSDVTHSSLNKQVNGIASDATNSSLNEQDNRIPSDVNNSGLNKQVNEIVSDVTYSRLNEQVNVIASDFTDSSLNEQDNVIASDITHSSLKEQENGIVSDITHSSLKEQENGIASDVTNDSSKN